ncbi:hypothetical protein [Paenisporosarcina sp. OV554]|uniref:hypothetical protein n=1 Tax=Paenisporosarcina sp. OV554 TaxID=2135694 RepID=UPI000D3A742D|nr:hypothetical protein [Paenisporosarcina sp. OV554]PUB10306.1 hypothetical protein C8K15_11921 [Paenisporosarcina sp. OV554]
MLGAGNWIGIVTTTLIVLCFYFTLTFFEHLRKGDERITKQSKIVATTCIALALIVPVVYNIYIYNEMMK